MKLLYVELVAVTLGFAHKRGSYCYIKKPTYTIYLQILRSQNVATVAKRLVLAAGHFEKKNV